MRIEHAGKCPLVDAGATIAATAVLSGEVTVAPGACILHGAVITAESGPISIGAETIVMENVVIRGTERHPVAIGNNVLVGPRAYLSGCTVEDEVFLATGVSIFNGAVIGHGAQVRINGVVHIKTRLAPDEVVPIGWVAVGDPAKILPPDRHDEIWAIQKELDFPGEVFGLKRPAGAKGLGPIMPAMTRRYARALASHKDDRVIEDF